MRKLQAINPAVVLILILLCPFYSYSSPQNTEEIPNLIGQGDQLYELRDDPVNAFKAIEKYEQAFKLNPQSYEASWKIAKTSFYLAEILQDKQDKEKKKKVVEKGVSFAEKAVKINPRGVEGHFWLGVCYTKVGEVKGVLKSLFLIGPIKREMRLVINMDDHYEGAGAYTVLGRVYSQVPGIFGGSNKKARQNYEKAKSISPGNSLNLLFLAETLWDMDEKQPAIKTLKELIELTPAPQWIPETAKNQKA